MRHRGHAGSKQRKRLQMFGKDGSGKALWSTQSVRQRRDRRRLLTGSHCYERAGKAWTTTQNLAFCSGLPNLAPRKLNWLSAVAWQDPAMPTGGIFQ